MARNKFQAKKTKGKRSRYHLYGGPYHGESVQLYSPGTLKFSVTVPEHKKVSYVKNVEAPLSLERVETVIPKTSHYGFYNSKNDWVNCA